MAPTIVFEEGKPVFTLGAPGGAWIGPAILQVLLKVLDWGMPVSEAVSAPRFSATSDAIDIFNRIPRTVQKGLEAKGYAVKRSPLSYPFAAPHDITCWDGISKEEPTRSATAMPPGWHVPNDEVVRRGGPAPSSSEHPTQRSEPEA